MSAVMIGYSVTGSCLQYILYRSDWDRLSKLIVERNGGIESNSSLEESDSSSEDSDLSLADSDSSSEEPVSRCLKGKIR